MKILIAGYGFVGQAHYEVLKKTQSVSIYDPALGYTELLTNPDAVIICVSTPARENGSCNVNNVADVISKINEDVPILIKSTISLEGWRAIRDLFPKHKLAFSPEFLRAETAFEDFISTDHLYLGGDDTGVWVSIFSKAFGNIMFSRTNVEELILIKYFVNSFLATKVSFFNQIYDLCESAGVNYETVSIGIGNDPRIGHSHTTVTENRGFGGHCFPKDTQAITKTGQHFDVDLSLLKTAITYNKSIRKS